MAIHASSNLVEHQIKQWQLGHQKSVAGPPPCVAISRLPGTPAAEIGQLVAERLGYGFFGIELVDEIARNEHVQKDIVAYMDEHVRSDVDRYLLDIFRNTAYNEKDYLHSVGRTIKGLANKGAAVILGRGAPFVMRLDQAVRVQIIGSRKKRVARLAEAKGCSESEADKFLALEESERLEFLREFVSDPDDPGHFDLVINTDNRTAAYWAGVIVHATEQATTS